MAYLSEKLMKDSFLEHMAKFENDRNQEYSYFRSFYEKDYNSIKTIIKKYYKDKPYSEKTFDEVLIIHHDIIHKTLDRLSAGIYDKEPTREIQTDTKDANEILSDVLNKLDYHLQVKEAFKKSLFFNIIGVEPIYRDGAIDLEILTPDMFFVKTGKNYYKAKEIKIERTNIDGTIYFVFWSDEQHYIYDTYGNIAAVEGNEAMINPYGVIPVAWLRILKGNDFFGEPEWDLFLDQIAIDMKITDYDLAEAIQRSGILFGINTNFPTGKRFRPNTVHQTNQNDPTKSVSLQPLSFGTDFGSWKESIDWRKKAILNNKGIVGASADSSTNDISGIAKIVDETSLMEKREGYRVLLKKFEINLLNKIRTVWNYHAIEMNEKLIPEGDFSITFSEQRPFETQEQKDKRREYELKYKIKDEIEIMLEELEVDETTLLEMLKKREERKIMFEKQGIILKETDTLRSKLIKAQNATG